MRTSRLLIPLACAAALAAAQIPKFENAQVESRAAGASLAADLHAAEPSPAPAWWGYAVPGLPGHGDNCGVAYLESGQTENRDAAQAPAATRPLVILYRLESGQVTKVRTFDTECALDAGGLRVTWLTGVEPRQSVALLSSLVQADKAGHGALAAVALSDGSEAERALESFTSPSYPEGTREQAVFWLGSSRGHAGFLALQSLARNEASDPLRKRITFALRESRDPAAVDELIRMAKADAAPEVRSQALFWLSQEAGQKAAGAIAAAVQNDPATAVKERAVFGLSQLPNGQGVPLLIQVAQSNSNPAVRKRAMFWLGQSKDPRAVAFFAEVLEKP